MNVVLKVLFVAIVCVSVLCTCCVFNVQATPNTDNISFRVLDDEQKGPIDNFVVLSDGSFAIVYDNEYICYYTNNTEFVYCIKILDVQGATLLCEYDNNVAFVQSRYKTAYVIRANDNGVSVECIQEELLNYNGAEFWRNSTLVEVQQGAQKYTLTRYSLYDKLFCSQKDTFKITDSNENELFVRSETNSYKSILLLFLFLIIVVIGILVIYVFYRKRRKKSA